MKVSNRGKVLSGSAAAWKVLNGKCCVQSAESTPRDDVIQWRTGALACPRSFNPLPPNPRIVVNGFDKSGANRVRNDIFACPANVLVSTNHTIEGFINLQGASPAERAICSVRRNALNPLHEGAESRILIWGRNQMCMIRHDHSAMKPIRDSMIVHDRVEHDVARRWW